MNELTGGNVLKTLLLVKHFMNKLSSLPYAENPIIEDKLLDILQRRFLKEYSDLTGEKFKQPSRFSLGFRNHTLCELDYPLAEIESFDNFFFEQAFSYGFFSSVINPFENMSLCEFYLYQEDPKKLNLDKFLSDVLDPEFLSDKELLCNSNFREILTEIINNSELNLSLYIWKFPSIPDAKKFHDLHPNADRMLFESVFACLQDLMQFPYELESFDYTTSSAYYQLMLLGFYGGITECYFYNLPRETFVKRLYIDKCLSLLNQKYGFYKATNLRKEALA